MFFLAQITRTGSLFGELAQCVRKTEQSALDWVERMAAVRSDTDDYVEEAKVYEIRPSGALRLVDRFDGLDRGDGLWVGWGRKCTWGNEHWFCRGKRAKGHTVCAYHKRWPHLVGWRDSVKRRDLSKPITLSNINFADIFARVIGNFETSVTVKRAENDWPDTIGE